MLCYEILLDAINKAVNDLVMSIWLIWLAFVHIWEFISYFTFSSIVDDTISVLIMSSRLCTWKMDKSKADHYKILNPIRPLPSASTMNKTQAALCPHGWLVSSQRVFTVIIMSTSRLIARLMLFSKSTTCFKEALEEPRKHDWGRVSLPKKSIGGNGFPSCQRRDCHNMQNSPRWLVALD